MFTPAEKQWMASFAAVDALFWLFILINCIAYPDLCGVGIGFSLVGFYAPFWFLLNPLGAVLQSYEVEIVVISIIGLACHVGIGWIIGRFARGTRVPWIESIAFSVLYIIIIAAVGNVLGYATNVFMMPG